ncbi:hypothetical protein [Sphingopyxis sp.]|uniref:hypothetical protein n=1 Tax=Sphingopyxis sp. TaxID=1908224 RepID=UPI003D121B43
MSDDQKKTDQADAILSMSFEQQLGYDVPRMWTTGAQFFGNNEHVLAVFREQTSRDMGDGTTTLHVRNVGSIIMPIQVARDVHAALGATLGAVTPNADD